MSTNMSKHRGVCPAWWSTTPGTIYARWSTVSRVGPVVPVCTKEGGLPAVFVVDPARVRRAADGEELPVVSRVIPAEYADEVRALVDTWDKERTRGAVFEALYGDLGTAERWAQEVYAHYEGEPEPEAWAGYLAGVLSACPWVGQ